MINLYRKGWHNMRLLSQLLLLLPVPCVLFGQEWELGASAGYGFPRQVSVSGVGASGSTGFASGVAFGALLGNQMNRWIAGEARYTYRLGDLKVSSGSVKATAAAQSHAIHYDVIVHGTKAGSPVRPFVAAGAGVKYYRGTGAEPAFQPLSNLVVLTHTSEAQPLVTFGGGVKFAVSPRALLRLDLRDYATPVPTNLLATPSNSKVHGWIHDFVFLVGISSTF